MAAFEGLHLALEEAQKQFIKEESVKNNAILLSRWTQLLIEKAKVIISGVKDPVAHDKYDPAAMHGPDGRTYIQVFSSKISFDESGLDNPMLCDVNELCQGIFGDDTLGGIALNSKPDEPVVLISKEDMMKGLQAVIKKDQA